MISRGGLAAEIAVGGVKSAEPAQRPEEQAQQADRYRCLHQHRAVEACLKGGNLGAQISFRCQRLDIDAGSIMLCRLPEGIRECVGLLVGKASVDEATGNRVSIEHRACYHGAPTRLSSSGDGGPSQGGPASTLESQTVPGQGVYGPRVAGWQGGRAGDRESGSILRG